MTTQSINTRYIIKVFEYMSLPKPRKKLIDTDGSVLPIITITTGLWEYV